MNIHTHRVKVRDRVRAYSNPNHVYLKDLGVLFSSDGTWLEQVNADALKTNKD